jgi:hypothetical protein
MDFELHSQDKPYIENAGYFDRNQIPKANQRTGSFWEWAGKLLGLPERPSVMVDSDQDGGQIVGLGGSGYSPLMSDDARWEAMRRRERRIQEATNSSPPTVTAADLVREAVTHVVEAVKAVKKTKPRDRAMTWLREQLEELGPTLAVEIERRAKAAKINLRTLRRARERLGVKAKRRGGGWWWSLEGQSE